jgi:hypothetical protein
LSLNVKHEFIDVVGKVEVKIGDGAPLQFDSISELDVVRKFIKEEILQVKVDVRHQQLLLKLQMNQTNLISLTHINKYMGLFQTKCLF